MAGPVDQKKKSHRLVTFCAWFLTVFIVLFPKGGIKLGPLPLTWGYMFLAFTTLPILTVRLLSFPLRLPLRTLAAMATLVPMQALFLYSAFFVGIDSPPYAASTFTSLFALPIAFLLVYPPFLRWLDGDKLSRYFRFSILGAALWGIFLFFWRPYTGHFIEIPLLTVNAADYGQLENTKYISRGFFFKLISTYNNGNVYGVATLILLPLYTVLEPVRWRRAAIKVALLLTLSRTVWVGLIINEMLPIGLFVLRQIPTFPVVYLRSFGRRLFAVALMFGLIAIALLFTGFARGGLAFLFDPTVGGRSGEIAAVTDVTVLPIYKLAGFGEVIYGSAAQRFGIGGLIGMLLLFLGPLLLLLVDTTALRQPVRRACLKGLLIYSVVAASDAAFDFIPVMAFYWFVYMVYLYGWPASFSPVVARAASAKESARRRRLQFWKRFRLGPIVPPPGSAKLS